MIRVKAFFFERRTVFVYLGIWFAAIWTVLLISSQINAPLFVSNTLYLLFFAVIHLGLIGQLYLLSKGENLSLRNGFQVAQRHFLDWVLVVIFAILYSIIFSLPLILVFIVASITSVGIFALISGFLACPLFLLLTVLLYEVGMRAVIFHDLPSNYAVKYAFKLIRQNLKASLKSLLTYFLVGFVNMFFVTLISLAGFLPYISNPDLTMALRLYTESNFLGFALSAVMFFGVSVGWIFSTTFMNTFFAQITDQAFSLKSIK